MKFHEKVQASPDGTCGWHSADREHRTDWAKGVRVFRADRNTYFSSDIKKLEALRVTRPLGLARPSNFYMVEY